MGDMGDIFKEMTARRRAFRDQYGVRCPRCPVVQPKREPTILLPQQRCKVCGYRDPRPRIDAAKEVKP